MIKFFRKIRYNLMSENKTGKYLKYAIGEIVLVVIGILIALQINSWNQQRINKQNEKIALVNLKDDVNGMENPTAFMSGESKEIIQTIGETGGLGTVATRADIIEKLFNSFVIVIKQADSVTDIQFW